MVIQESRAAARKPRDAEAILFGLMFANQTNITKQKILCLNADVNGLCKIYIKYVTSFCHILFQPKFRGVPFGADPWCGPYIPKTLAVDLFSMYYELFDHDTSTSRTQCCQFCAIYGINDLESRLEVIWGRDFCTSRGRIWLPIGPVNSNLGPILPHFRDIRAFVRWKPFFDTPPLFRSKFQVFPLE